MRPQAHGGHYRFRNINIEGELTVPNYKSKKYGRNSMKGVSVLRWNFFNKIFPDKDFISIPRSDLKTIISTYFIDKYKNNVFECFYVSFIECVHIWFVLKKTPHSQQKYNRWLQLE